MNRLSRTVIGGFTLLLVSVWMVLQWYPTYLEGEASKSWPSVKGVVEASDIQVGGSHGGRFWPWVWYHYTVSGQKYKGTYLVQEWSTEADAKKALVPYPDEKAIDVFYNPTNPLHSSLERGGLAPSAGGFLLIAGFAAVTGILLLLFSLGQKLLTNQKKRGPI